MIKFFRKIRQKLLSENKFSKYLIYATGEIVLVVIGILIALQINNWNEDRKERKQEQFYLNRLLQELPDSLGWNTAIEVTAERSREAKVNLERISSQNIKDTVLFVNKAFTIGNPLIRHPYIPAYDELVSTGKLSILKNDSLRTELRKYIEIFKWWDNSGDYLKWQSNFKNYRDHLHQYFSPLIMTEIGKASFEIIPIEQLKSMGIDIEGYLSDERSLYHLRKIISTHDQLHIMYQLIQKGRLDPLIEQVKREVIE